jgi:trans-aconitate methyltransferase
MSGYVSDVTYTLGFYRELAPTYLNLACIVNGVDTPPLSEPSRYCELGCGRGYGTMLLAAANPNIEFVGIDFNPSHIAEARSLATRAKLPNITFFEMDFADAARANDPKLADFNVVVLHGVYTWVGRQIRNDIHHFIRDKLLAGGVVFNSYNVLPGWATATPIQHLLMEVAQRSSGNSFAVIEEAQSLLKKLVDHASAFVVQNPGVKGRLEIMAKQDKSYLAHEFLNSGWEPLYVTDVMSNFADAKLTYVGSATLPENQLDLCVPTDLQPVVQASSDVGMRELLKDYVINKSFRRDIYVKGPQLLPQREQRQRFVELVFKSNYMNKDLLQKIAVPIGEFTPNHKAIAALLDAMGKTAVSGGDLIAAGEKAGLREAETILLILLLVHTDAVTPVRPDYASVDRSACHRLNEAVCELSTIADSHRFLASSILGSAIATSFVDRIFAPLIFKSPKASDVDIAKKAFERLEKAGQSFQREGRALEKTDENILEMSKVVCEFRVDRLPRWRELGIFGAN